MAAAPTAEAAEIFALDPGEHSLPLHPPSCKLHATTACCSSWQSSWHSFSKHSGRFLQTVPFNESHVDPGSIASTSVAKSDKQVPQLTISVVELTILAAKHCIPTL
eukprot:157422_1